MTAEIVARLEASFLIEDLDHDDAELSGLVADIDNLKQRVISLRGRK